MPETGDWKDNHYIPAYVRQYLFILAGTDNPDRSILCADTNAEALSKTVDIHFFEDDKPTEIMNDSLKLCQALHDQFRVTKEFTDALSQQGLLIQQSVKLTTVDVQESSASGFYTIDEKKFNQLPDDIFLDWRKRGWLPAIYFQLVSMNNWSLLATPAN